LEALVFVFDKEMPATAKNNLQMALRALKNVIKKIEELI